MPTDLLMIGATGAALVAAIAAVVAMLRTAALRGGATELERRLSEGLALARQESAASARELRQEVTDRVEALTRANTESLDRQRISVEQRLAEIKADGATTAAALREQVTGTLKERLDAVQAELRALQEANERRAEALRQTVEGRLEQMRTDNEAKLEQMRATVDEKLQGTLEKRLGESFGRVSEQLERVHHSVGAMKDLAADVGGLKRVLTNVKQRGTWGEVQLGTLLEQVLTADQFARNVEIVPGSGQRVEFAICLPGREDASVWLPIDAKFPQEDYERLLDAAERGDRDAEEIAIKAIDVRLRGFAKDIREKYVAPPHSTDFAVMYLPTEGLYAEALRRPGLASALQSDHRVSLAGPTTLLALLNSLQMGFRSLAIEKRSSEIQELLGAVKTEFGKYGDVLARVQKKLQEADKAIDQVGVRSRAISRRLRTVDALPENETARLLPFETASEDELADSEGAEG